MVFRLDRVQTISEDVHVTNGGIMVVCPTSLQPARIGSYTPSQLEKITIMATSTHSSSRMNNTVYRH